MITTSLLIICSAVATTYPSPVTSSATQFGIFVGTSPCDAVPRPFLKIPLDANCDRIKWTLTLNHDPATLEPTTYALNGEWGFHIDNRTYLTKGTIKGMEGKWTITRGTKTDPAATVIQLDPDNPESSIAFMEMDQTILHLLDRDKSLMVGHSGQSYTLSRTEKPTRPFTSVAPHTSPPIAPTSATNRSPILGVFVGRTPCREVAREWNKSVADDCAKIKWHLTLYQDPTTLTPTTYKLKSTFNREHVSEGKWTTLRGTNTNPSALIYQLDPDKPQNSLLLLKADDNILFFLDRDKNLLLGNLDFSCTLNGSARHHDRSSK